MRSIPNLRRLGSTAVSVSMIALLSATGLANAQESAERVIAVEAQPLNEALLDLGRQYDIVIVAADDLTRGKSAPAISGSYTPEQAVAQLLAGMDLEVSRTPSGAILLTKAASTERRAAPQEPERASQVESDPEPEPPIMDTIIVTGTDQTRYIVGSNDALGLDLDFLDNPRNITVIPEQLLLDRKITTLEEALRNVPGAVAAAGFGGTQDDFRLRGFRRNGEYRNGFRRASVYKANLANVEYVQVIRGPAAITYGQVEPGGVVDVVTKRPLAEQRIAGEFRVGQFNDYFGLLDWSQPITDKLGVRIVGSLQDAEGFRDFTEIKRNAFAFTADYELTDRARFNFSYEYRDESRPLDRGTVAVNTPDGPRIVNDIAPVPISRRFGDPWEIGEVELNLWEAGFEYNVNDFWNLEFNAGYEDSVGGNKQSRPRRVLVADAADGRIGDDGFLTPEFFAGVGSADPAVIGQAIGQLVGEYRRNVFDDPADRIFLVKAADGSREREVEAVYGNIRLSGDITTGPLTHRVSIGADYRRAEIKLTSARGPGTDGVNFGFFNILDPVYTLPDNLGLSSNTIFIGPDEEFGIYANSYTEIWGRLGLLLGVRYSEVDDRVSTPANNSFDQQKSSGLVPQVGLTFKAKDNISLYASYSESFRPNDVLFVDPVGSLPGSGDAPGLTFDPEKGQQIEAGVKAEFFNGRVQISLAVYSIEKVNILLGLDANDSPIFAEGQTSEGVELLIAGQPIPGMNVSASYAYTQSEFDGIELTYIPEHAVNLYASYEVQTGRFEGLGFGGGYYYESNRTGDFGAFDIGDINLVDASVWYTIGAPEVLGRDDGVIRLQVAAKNVFDDKHYLDGFDPQRISIGAPRTIVGSVSFDF